MSNKIANDIQTFYSYVHKTPHCWQWTGELDEEGYAWTDIPKRPRRAILFLYEMMYRPLAKSKRLGLACLNRRCVKPDHIEILGGYMDHLKLLRENGPAPMRRRKYDEPIASFWAKVNENGPTPTHKPELGRCWLWTGAPSKGGYASVHIEGKYTPVHRYAYTLDNGDVPLGLEIDHLCRNKLCVNPKHLEAVTHGENMRRATPFRKEHNRSYNLSHCKNGHVYTPETTIYRLNKKRNKTIRVCRTCVNQRRRLGFSGYTNTIAQAV